MKREQVLGVLAAITASCILAGCGKSSDGTQATAPERTEGAPTAEAGNNEAAQSSGSDEKVTLTVLAGQPTTNAGIEDMIDEALVEKYPNTTPEWECVGWGNGFQPKMQQYLQSGLPGVMIGKAQDVVIYAPLGVLGIIDDAYPNQGLDATRENVTADGKTCGMAYNALYQGVYYNKVMFEENGWEIPKTQGGLQKIVDDCNAKGITLLASHMVDTWSIGNMTMRFITNDVFNKDPEWGDKFRAGEVSFADGKEFQTAYEYNKLIFDSTFANTFSMEQTGCDARMVQGEAAMKVSGSWSIQNFLDINNAFEFSIFPFPNQTGGSKLIFEPNIIPMTSTETEHPDAVNYALDLLTSDKELTVEICDYTKTASMLKDMAPAFENPNQEDIDKYATDDMTVDVTLGNNQLVWEGFQEENAKDIAAWLQDDETSGDVLATSDAGVDTSSTTKQHTSVMAK